MRSGITRIFLPPTEFNPSCDGRSDNWETVQMQRQYRNLAVPDATTAERAGSAPET